MKEVRSRYNGIMAEHIYCTMCGRSCNAIKAIDDGWSSSFFDVDGEHGPACDVCTRVYLIVGVDGELETRPFIGV